MEAVDELLIENLRRLEIDLPQSVSSISEFASPNETAYEILVQCLWLINPLFRDRIRSSELPPNVNKRYQSAIKVANLVKEVGFKDHIGAETLLYGNIGELRNVLLFAVKRVPTDFAEPDQQKEKTNIDVLYERCALALTSAPPWLPWYCSNTVDKQNWHTNLPTWLNFGVNQPRLQVRSAINLTASSRRPKIGPKPMLPPKPSRLTDVDAATSSRNTATEQDTQKLKIEQHLADLNKQLDQMRDQIETLRFNGIQLKNDSKQLNTELDVITQSVTEADRKLTVLLADPTTNLHKLESFSTQTDERLNKLHTKWESHRASQAQTLDQLRSSVAQQPDTLFAEINDMMKRCDQIQQQLGEKERYRQQLERESGKLGERSVPRSAYTRRILDMVASVNKQTKQIEQVLNDNISVQRDINSLTGKLQRSFTAVDEGLYAQACQDESLRRAYKLLVQTHETCSSIVDVVQQTGTVHRQLLDLQHALETETQKSTDTTLERLINDYCKVKQQNQELQSIIGDPPAAD